jgi:hypothetical protein
MSSRPRPLLARLQKSKGHSGFESRPPSPEPGPTPATPSRTPRPGDRPIARRLPLLFGRPAERVGVCHPIKEGRPGRELSRGERGEGRLAPGCW